MKRIDLHTHSTCSDGTVSPTELIKLAKEAGLGGIAITDHDTMAGTSEALNQGDKQDVLVIPGIELSVKHNETAIHILGYGLDQHNPNLQQTLHKLQEARRKRNQQIIEKLAACNIQIDITELQEIGKGQIGRPHFARLLVKKGVVKTVNAAFTHFLKKGAAVYAECYKLPADDAIKIIAKAGGIAMLAHPGSIDLMPDQLPSLLRSLAALGLTGLELYYPTHSAKTFAMLKQTGEELGLIFCGGSDFHGDDQKNISVKEFSKLSSTPYNVWPVMQEKLRKTKQQNGTKKL